MRILIKSIPSSKIQVIPKWCSRRFLFLGETQTSSQQLTVKLIRWLIKWDYYVGFFSSSQQMKMVKGKRWMYCPPIILYFICIKSQFIYRQSNHKWMGQRRWEKERLSKNILCHWTRSHLEILLHLNILFWRLFTFWGDNHLRNKCTQVKEQPRIFIGTFCKGIEVRK